jgi:hypothetical protein
MDSPSKQLSKNTQNMKFMSRVKQSNIAKDIEERNKPWGKAIKTLVKKQSFLDFMATTSTGRKSFGQFNKETESHQIQLETINSKDDERDLEELKHMVKSKIPKRKSDALKDTLKPDLKETIDSPMKFMKPN